MNEEEMIDILQNVICDEVIGTYCLEIQKTTNCSKNCEKEDCYLIQAIEGIIDLYNKEKEKYKRLSIEAQATAFDDQNKDTEGLLRVLLKQGEITLDEKGYYQREDFDWEENLYKLGLMKKKEKCFYIPDDECLDEYTKQLENQLKEYNEIKETFRKYCVMDNDTLYDGCCKMQDEIDELKEKNKELDSEIDKLQEKNQVLKVMSQNNFTNAFMESNYISKDKINSKIEEYEEMLKSPIIKDDYKREVEHIIRVLKEVGGKE